MDNSNKKEITDSKVQENLDLNKNNKEVNNEANLLNGSEVVASTDLSMLSFFIFLSKSRSKWS